MGQGRGTGWKEGWGRAPVTIELWFSPSEMISPPLPTSTGTTVEFVANLHTRASRAPARAETSREWPDGPVVPTTNERCARGMGPAVPHAENQRGLLSNEARSQLLQLRVHLGAATTA